MNVETIQPYVSFIKDVISGLAAFTAAVIAIMGFRTWKKQLHWKTQYELAQRLLRSTYKIRDELILNKSGDIDESKMFPTIMEENDDSSTEKKKKEDIINHEAEVEETFRHYQAVIAEENGHFKAAYQKSWRIIQEAYIELQNVSLEAEAFWGPAARDSLEPLMRIVKAVLTDRKQFMQSMDTMVRIFDIYTAVNKIEDFLKPYLKI